MRIFFVSATELNTDTFNVGNTGASPPPAPTRRRATRKHVAALFLGSAARRLRMDSRWASKGIVHLCMFIENDDVVRSPLVHDMGWDEREDDLTVKEMQPKRVGIFVKGNPYLS